MPQRLIDPPLQASFDEIFEAIANMPDNKATGLRTTGGVLFEAETKLTRDNRPFISLPHNNRIYEHDWGYQTNSMGRTDRGGQRIGHYARPLDEWYAMHVRNR